jgi:cytoskeletal protein RodZ
MQRKALCLFVGLLVLTALVALAQSPTTSAPGNGTSSTQEPYGATLDHPNPNSANEPSSGRIKTSTAPGATADTSATSPSSSTTDNSMSSSSSNTTSTDTASSSTAASSGSLPRTASELPLLACLGLLALGGALAVRTASKNAA